MPPGPSGAGRAAATAAVSRESAQASAREAAQEAKQLYRAGKLEFLNLLDAQRTLAQADDAVATSHARLATNQIAIFLALGGGVGVEDSGQPRIMPDLRHFDRPLNPSASEEIQAHELNLSISLCLQSLRTKLEKRDEGGCTT